MSFAFVVRGLPNIGATCYLNSILQILLNIPEMQSLKPYRAGGGGIEDVNVNVKVEVEVERVETADGKDVCLNFEKFMHKHINNHEQIHELRAFIRSFICYYQNFGSGMQDQHEYLMLLFKIIHDCRNKPCSFTIKHPHNLTELEKLEIIACENLRKDGMWISSDNLSTPNRGYDSIIFQTFTGQFHAQTTCSKCSYISNRFETFRAWEIDIYGNTLEECLSHTVQQTQLDEDQTYECDKCKKHNRSFRKITLWRAPPVLIINLKRFIANIVNGNLILSKNSANITIPVKLDIRPYISLLPNSTQYSLFAVAHHIGNANSGHCFSCIKSPAPAPEEKWYNIDDSNVIELTNIQIQQHISGSSPYILFYRRN